MFKIICWMTILTWYTISVSARLSIPDKGERKLKEQFNRISETTRMRKVY